MKSLLRKDSLGPISILWHPVFHFSHLATQKSQDLPSLHLTGLQYCNNLW